MRTLTWTDAAGASTVFDGSAGITMLDNPVGLEAAVPSNTLDDYIAFDGAVLVGRRRSARHIALALFVEHATRVETAIATLATMLQGPGSLVYADDVNTRTLRQVIYEAGIDGSGDTTVLTRELVVSLLALDPWFYGAAQASALSLSNATPFDAVVAFDAVLPFDGGSSSPVTVLGDGDAYPVITIVGPATTVLITNSAGGGWSVAAPLLSTDTLVVDSRPGSRGPRLNGGVVNWALLNATARLFTLAPGIASVVTATSGTTGATSINMTFEPRYLTP